MFWFVVSGVLLLFAFRFRFPYFIADVQYTHRMLLLAYHMIKIRKSKPLYTLVDRFLEQVQKHPNKALIRFGDDTYSYVETDRRSNKIARCLLKHADLHEGDSVALLMGNEPMFVWIWLALMKIGCSVALLNYNIRSRSLLHCFSCSGAKTLIASAGNFPTTSLKFIFYYGKYTDFNEYLFLLVVLCWGLNLVDGNQ